MLLIPTIRAQSPLHGTGLFTDGFVTAGTPIWEFTEGFDLAVAPGALDRMPAPARGQFLNYSYLDREVGEYVLCADDARFMNHSDTPTTSDRPHGRYGRTVAARDLAPGEELTCDYREFDAGSHHLGSCLQDLNQTAAPATSFVAHGLEVRQHDDKGGGGLHATRAFAPGEVLVVWGGEAVHGESLRGMGARDRRFAVQVDDDVFLVPARRQLEPGDFVNHSCNPNAGMRGQITVVAMRAIAPGEEICFDYAMTDSSPYDEFDCGCRQPHCRGRVRATDWQLPFLQRRYRGFFAPHIERRISRERRLLRLATGS